jgi:hypothetical protein
LAAPDYDRRGRDKDRRPRIERRADERLHRRRRDDSIAIDVERLDRDVSVLTDPKRAGLRIKRYNLSGRYCEVREWLAIHRDPKLDDRQAAGGCMLQCRHLVAEVDDAGHPRC